jgi:2,5-dihydroxypyridine 5,6-dioxygenase
LDEITEASDSGAALLSEGKEIRITSSAGTDLVASCVGRRANSQDGVVRKRGEWDSACTAIVGIAPLEDDVEGTVVVSEGDTVSMRPHKFVVETPIKLTVKKGRLVEALGGREARYVRDWLRSFEDPNSYVFAHTGFGTDPRAQVVANESAEWESVAGGVNIAFGSNIFRGLGGKNYAKSHMDIVLFETTMSAGNRKIVLDGKIHL